MKTPRKTIEHAATLPAIPAGALEIAQILFVPGPTDDGAHYVVTIKREADVEHWIDALAAFAETVATHSVADIDSKRGTVFDAEMAERVRGNVAHAILSSAADRFDGDLDDEDEDYDTDAGHPGAMAIPEPIQRMPNAVQVMSGWLIPAVVCPDCGEEHPEITGVGVPDENLPDISTGTFGAILASAASEMAKALAKRGVGDAAKLRAEIDMAFHGADAGGTKQ